MEQRTDDDRWLDEALARVHVDVPAGTAERVLARLSALPPQRVSIADKLADAWNRFLGGLQMPAWSQAATLATAAVLGVLVGLSDIGAAEPPASNLMAIAFDTAGEEP